MRLRGAWSVVVAVMGIAACAESTHVCGGGETVRVSGSTYCVYEQSVVIVGGFDCPASMPFRMDFETATVCGDHGFNDLDVPEDICARAFVPCTDAAQSDAGVEPMRCGGNVCAMANATVRCSTRGVCILDTCLPGFGNCDGQPSNGCETALETLANCGQCGQVCTEGCCSEGMCGNCSTGGAGGASGQGGFGGSCAPEIEACDRQDNDCDGLVDEMCGESDAGGACAAGLADCNGDSADGCETSLDTVINCGLCGRSCAFPNATSGCDNGSCNVVSCNASFGDCDAMPDNGCETALNTDDNCGACGVVCGAFCTTDRGQVFCIDSIE